MKNNKMSKNKKIAIKAAIIAGCILLILGAAILIFKSCAPKTQTDISLFEQNKEGTGDEPAIANKDGIERKSEVYNFLVIGKDKVGMNTDVIMAVSFDTKKNNVSILQIPRDTYVEYGGYGRKINSVYSAGYNNASKELSSLYKKAKGADSKKIKTLAEESKLEIDKNTLSDFANDKLKKDDLAQKYGVAELQKLIKQTLGIITDYYVMIDTKGFVDVVNAIGGVDVYIQHDMKYSDPVQGLNINLKAGNQHLDGEAAEGFVRFRYGYVQADIARIDAQKIFMSAFIKKVLKMETVTKIPSLIKTVNNYLDTDISMKDATYFAVSALSVKTSDISMMTLPGAPHNSNGVSYYSIYKKASLETVNQYFNVMNVDIPESAVKVKELVSPSDDAKANTVTATDIEDNKISLDFVKNHGSTNKPSKPPVEEKTEPDNIQKEETVNVPADNENTQAGDPAESEPDGNGTGEEITVVPDKSDDISEDEKDMPQDWE